MATCQQSQNLAELKFNYFNYTLLCAECQTAFNPHEMDIEGKLFALAIWIWVGTLHQKHPEAPRWKYVFLCIKSAFILIIKAHLSNDSNNSLCR